MNKLSMTLLLAGSGVALLAAYLSQEDRTPDAATMTANSQVKDNNDMYEAVALLSSKHTVPQIALRDLFSDPSTISSALDGVDMSSTKAGQSHKVELPPPPAQVFTPPLLMGVVLRKSGHKAFFSDNDELYSVGIGGVIGGRYRILRIRDKSVLIQDVTSGHERTIYIKD